MAQFVTVRSYYDATGASGSFVTSVRYGVATMGTDGRVRELSDSVTEIR